MWLKKPVSVARSKSKIAILLILNVVILGELMQVTQVKGEEYNFDYIDNYKKEAKEYVGETGKGDLAGKVKELDGYTDKPKEVGYSEHELRSKGDARVKGEEKDENEGVREAIGAAKSSYAENPHRSSYTVGKLQHEGFIKKSDAVTSNPISGLNVEGKTECKIADKNVGGENVEFEEYYVDVEDSRLIREDKKCEEDEDRLFYCIRKIKDVKCQEKGDCGYNVGGVLLDSVKSGIVYRYSYPTLTFGNAYGISSGYMTDAEMAQSTVFRCGTNCCGIETIRANFDIKDKNNIGTFKLSRITSVQPLMIKLNGEVIYHSFGGYKFEKTGRYASGNQLRSYYAKNDASPPREWTSLIDTGNGEYSCYPNNLGYLTIREGSGIRTAAGGEYFRPLDDRDLKQKLREGSNQLEITLAFDDIGFLETEFYLQQYCCKEWSDEWDGDCPL